MAQLPKLLATIANGRAVFVGGDLRCAAPRGDKQRCNKLIAKVNVYGMIAGEFRCERCKEDIEVRLILPDPLPQMRFGETHLVSEVSR